MDLLLEIVIVLMYPLLVPARWLLRVLGRDPLRIRRQATRDSYWLVRASADVPAAPGAPPASRPDRGAAAWLAPPLVSLARLFAPPPIPRVPTLSPLANADVLAFYKELPFNYYGSLDAQRASVERGRAAVEAQAPLPALLVSGARVLDVGCGAGWLANSMAYHYPVRVTGIDFNAVAITRARDVARAMKLDAEFHETDLFRFAPPEPFDVAVSLGVLHHTNDCLAALRHVAGSMVREGGHLYVGLYHLHGRAPFLEHFARLRAEGASEEALYAEYRRLHVALTDETHLRSWFRDQVLHPHESQHTLAEVARELLALGYRIVATSVNRFEPIADLEALYAAERQMDVQGRAALAEGRYYPGFFTVLAHRERPHHIG